MFNMVFARESLGVRAVKIRHGWWLAGSAKYGIVPKFTGYLRITRPTTSAHGDDYCGASSQVVLLPATRFVGAAADVVPRGVCQGLREGYWPFRDDATNFYNLGFVSIGITSRCAAGGALRLRRAQDANKTTTLFAIVGPLAGRPRRINFVRAPPVDQDWYKYPATY
ncbi:hypothetical protein BOTBODRAFT_147784 [Botryobasidium botryosum FD-172 SS1]|uniref:Uncharacterized protein n=1 Tax=Botryobasidium botryosum (strain FD-172 SS1) TaxID=930990 RepID=A0A067M386_BOTB1|nr:hypothetical protein BOTBODRAFT_147784 [Botryobasidium botryosum FD-172 SS1]